MNDADKAYLLRASQGNFDPNYVPSDEQPEQPDISPHEILAFSVPTEGGTGSGSGSEESVQQEHPQPPVEILTPRPEVGPTSENISPPAVSLSGSNEPNVTEAPPAPPATTPPPTAPSSQSTGLVSHNPGAGVQGEAGPVGRLPFPVVARPAPPDYSGGQFWQDKLEQSQRAQVAAIDQGDHDSAAVLQRFKDEHAIMVRAHDQANEEAHKALLDQKAAQDRRWDAFQQREIDPDRYVHNMPAWQRALSLIAIGLGGALEGFQGTPNRAMQAFQDAIGRDIEAQKAEFERDQRALERGDNLYAQNYQLYQDDKAARAATESDHWQMAKFEIENLRDKSNTAMQRAQLEGAAAVANQRFEDARASAGVQTALVRANKAVALARQQAAAVQAQATGDLQPGSEFARATGQPLPKPVADGKPASPKVQTAPPADFNTRPLDPKLVDKLVPHGTDGQGHDVYILPATAEDKAAGKGRGRIVVATSQGYVETDLPADYETGSKGGKGLNIRANMVRDIKQSSVDLETLKTLTTGLKFGAEGASARERYNIVQRRHPELPKLDMSSSDAFDRSKAALDEAIGDMERQERVNKDVLDMSNTQGGAGSDDQK